MSIELEFARNFIGLKRNRNVVTAIYVERWEHPVPFEVEKNDGEYVVDWKWWRIFFTAPWLKAPLTPTTKIVL